MRRVHVLAAREEVLLDQLALTAALAAVVAAALLLRLQSGGALDVGDLVDVLLLARAAHGHLIVTLLVGRAGAATATATGDVGVIVFFLVACAAGRRLEPARPAAPRTGCCPTRRCRGCRRHGSDGSDDGDGISCPNPRRAPRRRPAYRRCRRAPGPPRSAPLRRLHGAPARSGDGCGATNAPARRPRRIRHGCGCRRYRSCRRARCGSDRRYRDGRKRSCPCPPAHRHVTHDHCASDGLATTAAVAVVILAVVIARVAHDSRHGQHRLLEQHGRHRVSARRRLRQRANDIQGAGQIGGIIADDDIGAGIDAEVVIRRLARNGWRSVLARGEHGGATTHAGAPGFGLIGVIIMALRRFRGARRGTETCRRPWRAAHHPSFRNLLMRRSPARLSPAIRLRLRAATTGKGLLHHGFREQRSGMALDLQRDRGTGGTGATNHAAATATTTRRRRRFIPPNQATGRIGVGRLLFFGFVTTETVIVHTRHDTPHDVLHHVAHSWPHAVSHHALTVAALRLRPQEANPLKVRVRASADTSARASSCMRGIDAFHAQVVCRTTIFKYGTQFDRP